MKTYNLYPGTRSISLEHLLFMTRREAQRWLDRHHPGCYIKVIRDGTAIIFDKQHREIAWIGKRR